MNKLRLFPVATLVAAILLAPVAFAQTPANISIISGNGQITCPQCTQQGFGLQIFDPLYVRVTDANGNPVSGATVNWTVVAGQGNFPNGTQSMPTTTDANGNTSNQYQLFLQSISGSALNPFVPNTIIASIATGAAATFFETQALVSTTIGNTNTPVFVAVQDLTPASSPACPTCISPGDTLTGAAGSTSSTQFKIQVYVPGGTGGVPNVSLRLVPNITPGQVSPTISCATGAGADPGSVLTDQFGNATCTAVFGPTPGFGSFYALIGGVAASVATGGPLGFLTTGNYNLHVLPGVAGMLSIVSGNTQSGTPGQALTSALQATVGDNAGNPLAGQAVVWTVSPTGAATLSNTSTTSDANGHVQTNVALSSSASGTIQVKVALASNPNVAATFTVTATTTVQVSGLQIVSGNSQSAAASATFAQPLVVQLTNTNGTAVANVPVSFSVSGPAVLTSSSATTDSTGKAQVNVIAGATSGAVTVTATAQGFSQSFSLTVVGQGPTLTINSFFNGADFQQGSISPCSIATIMAPGIAPSIQGAVAYDGIGGLPYLLAGDSVTFNGAQTPIYNVANMNGQQQITFQIPCSVTPGSSVPVTVNVGGATATVNVQVLAASPGLFTTQLSSTSSVPVLERPDGSFVNATNTARRGETLIAYVTGLGPTTPSVTTNSLPVPGSTAAVQGTVVVGVNGQGANLISANLSPDLVGVYMVSFQVPSSTLSGTNASFSIGVIPQGTTHIYYSSLGFFPVQ